MKVFAVFEFDYSGLGDWYGGFSSVELASEAAKAMLDSVLLYDSFGEHRQILSYEEIEALLASDKHLAVFGDTGNQGIILSGNMNQRRW